jgi:dipeptidyl aminopeptidase/acylaminoacyl peptidase
MCKGFRLFILIISTVAVMFVSCTRQEAPPKQYSLETFLSVYKTWGASFSPEEKAVAFITNRSGQFNIWTVDCHTSLAMTEKSAMGGEAKQLTDYEDAVFFVTWCKHENSLIFSQDRGGNENFHLYIMPAIQLDSRRRGNDKERGGGDAVDLTPGEEVNAMFLGWAHDGHRFLFHTNQRDPRFFDVYLYDLRTRQAKMIFENETGLEFSAMDNEVTKLAFTKPYTQVNSDVFLYDIEAETLTPLTLHQGNINYEAMDFSPDGRELYMLTDKGSEFTYLISMDLETKDMVEIKRTNWDMVWAGFSFNGTYFVTAVNEDGRIVLEVIETATGTPLELPTLPDGELSGISFSRSERYMAFYFTGDMVPSDLHVMDMEEGTIRRLTYSMPDEIDPNDLVESELIRYRSFDGLEIPAYLYRPKGIASGEKRPAILLIHGGPQAQERKGFSSIKQYMVNQGWVLMVPNVRGSAGYGRTYYSMDDRDWGGAPLRDVVEAKNYLARLDYVDPEKIVILGGSYGGYMVLAAMAFTPEEFAAGVDICGLSNLTTFLESIPPYWEPYKNMLIIEVGDPEKDADFLKARSPLFSADNIIKPLFVVQGANDPRVKRVESDAIVEAIKAREGVVEYMIFEDEGHGLRKKENIQKAYNAIFAFLDEHVRQ